MPMNLAQTFCDGPTVALVIHNACISVYVTHMPKRLYLQNISWEVIRQQWKINLTEMF